MASTFSTNLAIELIGTGDQAGTWGVTTNTNLGTLIEQAISGYVTQAVSTGADTTITIPNGATGVARNMYIELTGTGGASTNLIVPSNKKLYFIFNNTASGQVTVKVSGQTGVSVPNGKKMVLVCNGTDVVNGLNYIADFGTNSFTVTNLTASSGTITNLIATTGTITTLSATSGNISNLVSSDASATVLRAGSATLTHLSATSASITNLALTSLTISSLSITNVSVASATVSSNLTLSGGTANGVLYLNGSKVATSGSALQFSGTGLGIRRAASSGYVLDVDTSSGDVARIIGSDQANVRLRLENGGSGGRTWELVGGLPGANNANFSLYDVTGAATRLTIDSSGNLGIGTSSPTNYGATYKTLAVNGSSTGIVDVMQNGTVYGQLSTEANVYKVEAVGASTVLRLVTNSATRATLDSSGNLGLGVTPSAWFSTRKVFQLADYAALTSFTGSAGFERRANAFLNASAQEIYQNNEAATIYSSSGGQHRWYNAPSGTAGNAISFTQAMTLNASGQLSVGTTSANYRLRVASADNSGSTVISRFESANELQAVQIRFASVLGDGGDFTTGTSTNHNTIFYTNNTERMRLDTSGNLGLSTVNTSSNFGKGNGYGGNTSATASGYLDPYNGSTGNTMLYNTGAFPILFGTNNTERARIDASGNLGLGVTPSAWGSNLNALQVRGASLASSGNTSSLCANAFYDGTNWKYINTAAATHYEQTLGQFRWFTAPSGTAGNAISFTQAMTLTAAGALGLGTTSPNKVSWDSNAQVMTIFGPQRGAIELGADSPINNDQCGNVSFMSGTTQKAQIQCRLDNSGNGSLVFFANSATERARITADGNFAIGTTTASYKIQSSSPSGADRDMFLSGIDGVTNGVHWAWVNSSSTINLRFGALPTTASAANLYSDSVNAEQVYRSTSSIRYKKDIESVDHKFSDAALNLRPVWYRSKAEGDNKEWSWYGLIAEEVAEVEPRLVHWTYPEDAFDVETIDGVIKKTVKEGAKRIPDGVQYERLSVLLLDIVKRQNARLEQLEAKVAALESK